MPYIKIHKVKEEIKHYSECMTLLQARNELKWIIEHKCINCNEQCSDCYLHYKDKIAIEHILEYLNKTIPKRTINSKRGVLKGK